MAIYECLSLKEKMLKCKCVSELPCSLCLQVDNMDMESVGYCTDCMQHMCAACLLDHDEAFHRKPHYLILHFSCKDEKILSVYCPHHRKLCKKRCTIVDARSFDQSIANLVNSFEKAFNKGDEVKSITTNVKGLLDQVERISKSRLTPEKVNKQQEIINDTFYTVRSKMNTYFDELEKIADNSLKEAVEEVEAADDPEVINAIAQKFRS